MAQGPRKALIDRLEEAVMRLVEDIEDMVELGRGLADSVSDPRRGR